MEVLKTIQIFVMCRYKIYDNLEHKPTVKKDIF